MEKSFEPIKYKKCMNVQTVPEAKMGMSVIPSTDSMHEYIKEDEVIDYSNENITQLAFPIRPEKGETDRFIVYPDPDIKVLEKLRKCKTRTELWDNLPTELAYDR